MYFLNDDERKLLLRKLLPEARALGVVDELRGWNWHSAPLTPVYDGELGVWEMASTLCASGRDLYLRRVLGLKALLGSASDRESAGVGLRVVARGAITEAKRLVYEHGADCLPFLADLIKAPQSLSGANVTYRALNSGHAALEAGSTGSRAVAMAKIGDTQSRVGLLERATAERGRQLEVGGSSPRLEAGLGIENLAQMVWEFEVRRVMGAIEGVLVKHGQVGKDALAMLAMPVAVDYRLDGRLLGLSANLSADLLMLGEVLPAVVKFGPRREFHRLAVTGYAMAAESVWECPVNMGCVIYVSTGKGRVLVARDLFVIGDELRQEFIEARDERMRLVEEEIDPGLPAECYSRCQFYGRCHG